MDSQNPISELLSLKWNNHKSTFLGLLKLLRNQASYCDATLACEGKFYQVHKIVLSACSDYFGEIFEHTSCKNPVIVLKDISYRSLEFLLDYMYLGEVTVKQNELSVLNKAAECLQIKGLIAPDDEHSNNIERTKSIVSDGDEPSPKRRKNRHFAIPSPTEKFCQPIISITVDDPLELAIKSELVEEVNPEDCNLLVEKEYETVSSDKRQIDYDPGSSGLGNESDDNWQDYHFEDDNQTPTDLDPNLSSDLSGQSAIADKEDERLTNVRCTYHCELCEYKSGFSSHIKRHMMIHTGEKPFFCTKCPYRSSQEANLIKHFMRHTGEKPFACQNCAYRTSKVADLKKHMRKHTGEKPFVCQNCDFRTSDGSNFRKHMKQKHPLK